MIRGASYGKAQNRNGRVSIAQHTMGILGNGTYRIGNDEVDISESIRYCRDSTTTYSPDQLDDLRQNDDASHVDHVDHTGMTTTFEVVNESTLSAAKRLRECDSHFQEIGVLNFASAKHPGGGFLTGAAAQEESIARSSALYEALTSNQASAFYNHNISLRHSFYSDYLIHTPSCPVFKLDHGELIKPYHISIITCPAVNYEHASRHYREGKITSANRSQPFHELNQETMRRRIRNILVVAKLHQKIDCLVLGAWGCGAFGQDPRLIASLFADELDAFRGSFRHVCFAILDTRPGQRMIQPFIDLFSS